MYQEIIAYTIITIVAIWGAYKLYQNISGSKDPCENCEAECSSCSIRELKKEIEQKKKKS